jgi:pyruvate dehydrogenase E2 component (dihydrolipoamide acetyltransferase)
MSALEVRVPNIGGFKDVGVIEVLVKPGDQVATDASLVTLESDKATMDVPAPFAGTVREVRVKVGDRVGEGSLVLLIEPAEAAEPVPASAAAAPAATPSPAPARTAAEASAAAPPATPSPPAPPPRPPRSPRRALRPRGSPTLPLRSASSPGSWVWTSPA